MMAPRSIGIISLFPEMFEALNTSITGRAIEKGLIELHYWNPRDFSEDKHRCVDDRPYGGGPGMVMMVQPLRDAIIEAKKTLGLGTKTILLSPQGRTLDQQGVKELAGYEKVIFVCGRYEGVDERLIEQHIDEQWSIGDYVLTGGELPAMVLIDALTRQIPGALGHEDSAEQDSFATGILDCPHYTRPETIDGEKVPSVLLSGDHKAIKAWRNEKALEKTKVLRR